MLRHLVEKQHAKNYECYKSRRLEQIGAYQREGTSSSIGTDGCHIKYNKHSHDWSINYDLSVLLNSKCIEQLEHH